MFKQWNWKDLKINSRFFSMKSILFSFRCFLYRVWKILRKLSIERMFQVFTFLNFWLLSIYLYNTSGVCFSFRFPFCNLPHVLILTEFKLENNKKSFTREELSEKFLLFRLMGAQNKCCHFKIPSIWSWLWLSWQIFE